MRVLEAAGVGVGGAIFMAMVFLIAAVICLYAFVLLAGKPRDL